MIKTLSLHKMVTFSRNLLEIGVEGGKGKKNVWMNLKGRVGITLNVNWMEPEDPDDSSHHEASDTKLEFDFGWYAHPILIDGTYPDVMREKVPTFRV